MSEVKPTYVCLVEIYEDTFNTTHFKLENIPESTYKWLKKHDVRYDMSTDFMLGYLFRKEEAICKDGTWYDEDDNLIGYEPLGESLPSDHIFNGTIQTIIYRDI